MRQIPLMQGSGHDRRMNWLWDSAYAVRVVVKPHAEKRARLALASSDFERPSSIPARGVRVGSHNEGELSDELPHEHT